MYIINMNQRNILIASIIANIALFAFIFIAKENVKDQAQKQINKLNHIIAQTTDNYHNNALLWSMIDSTWKSQDKSKTFVKKLAESQKLTSCKGKPCTEATNEAQLKTVIRNDAKERSIMVGWGSGKDKIKYSFKVIYDDENNFANIDINELLDQKHPFKDSNAEQAENVDEELVPAGE
jgi:hypothetical protein